MLTEVFSGRPRPRHLRFSAALARLVPGLKVERRDQERWNRIAMALSTRTCGVRRLTLPTDGGHLVHQALSESAAPYIAEFDVPLALHGYDVARHRRHAERARRLLDRDALRGLVVFSEWAKRSFELHYGEAAAAKSHVVYPLASPLSASDRSERTYDFCFISTQFRIKAGPALVRAFARARAGAGGEGRLCVVTDLEEARRCLGDLDRYPGIDWRTANLNEKQVAELLADSCCLVHPALAESFGVVVLEALAAGCAVVSTDIASFPELVRHGENGIVVRAPIASVAADAFITEYGNAAYFASYLDTLHFGQLEEALQEAMTGLLEPSARSGLMAASRDIYRERYSEAAWARRMSTLLGDAFPDLELRSLP